MLLVKTLTPDGTNSSSMRNQLETLSTSKEKLLVSRAKLTTKTDKLFSRTKETMKFHNNGTSDTRIEPSQSQLEDTAVNGD